MKDKITTAMTIVAIFFLSATTDGKKKFDPLDKYDHEMHNSFYKMANFPCETCHTNENAFTRETVNRLGCHQCHNNPNPPLPAEQNCNRCHPNGRFPKPDDHKSGWMSKHEVFAKQDPARCAECHRDTMFCIDCHKRRDTIGQKMHRRNFRFFHSIEARANPRKCDTCHVVNFCQDCHAGRGSSNR